MNNLEEIALRIIGCADCELSQGRNKAVPGEGSSQAELMFIGEGPGYHEDRLGRPFVGPAGQFLDDLLKSIGLTRSDVFIANMVKCRPPQNRDPSRAEMSACSKYLNRQITLINPRLIVTLGRFAMSRFFPGESITRIRGKAREKDGRWIYPIMHPAAALHRQELRAGIISDFKGIPGVLESLDQPSSDLAAGQQATAGPPARPQQETAPAARQLSLFG